MTSKYGGVAIGDEKVAQSKSKYGGTPLHVEPQEEQEPEEGSLASTFRYAAQLPKGFAKAKTFYLDLINAVGVSEALDPEEMDHIRKISEREGIPFDEQSYLEAAREAAESFPTVENISRGIENKTGLPLQAKTGGQKLVELAGMGGGLGRGGFSPGGAITAPAFSATAQAAGVPEEVAEGGALLAAGGVANMTPTVSVEKSTKPSGLTKRQFEKIKKPTEVSSKRLAIIKDTLEQDFKSIHERIQSSSPIADTTTQLKKGIEFKEAASEAFRDVERLADEIPGKFPSKKVKKTLVDMSLKKRKGMGFIPGEEQKSYVEHIKQILKDTPKKPLTARDLVVQYRLNNKEMGRLYEPGKSSAYNAGKKTALQDANKALAQMIESEYPNSEFAKLFKSSNEQWAKIMDAEVMDKFVGDLFDGKINYKKGKDLLLGNSSASRAFERGLGPQGYHEFKQLTRDLMSSEEAAKMLRAADKNGFNYLVENAAAFAIHPKFAKWKLGYGLVKETAKKIWQATLDKPQLALRWNKGLKAFKKGDFETAEKEFQSIEKEVEILDKEHAKMDKAAQKKAPQEGQKIDITPQKNAQVSEMGEVTGRPEPKQISHHQEIPKEQKSKKTGEKKISKISQLRSLQEDAMKKRDMRGGQYQDFYYSIERPISKTNVSKLNIMKKQWDAAEKRVKDIEFEIQRLEDIELQKKHNKKTKSTRAE